MHQMRRIGNRHQGNAGAIKRTSALGGTGFGLLLTGLIVAFPVFLMVMLTTRLGQEFADFGCSRSHGNSEKRAGREGGKGWGWGR
jgi:hypothetical protein